MQIIYKETKLLKTEDMLEVCMMILMLQFYLKKKKSLQGSVWHSRYKKI